MKLEGWLPDGVAHAVRSGPRRPLAVQAAVASYRISPLLWIDEGRELSRARSIVSEAIRGLDARIVVNRSSANAHDTLRNRERLLNGREAMRLGLTNQFDMAGGSNSDQLVDQVWGLAGIKSAINGSVQFFEPGAVTAGLPAFDDALVGAAQYGDVAFVLDHSTFSRARIWSADLPSAIGTSSAGGAENLVDIVLENLGRHTGEFDDAQALYRQSSHDAGSFTPYLHSPDFPRHFATDGRTIRQLVDGDRDEAVDYVRRYVTSHNTRHAPLIEAVVEGVPLRDVAHVHRENPGLASELHYLAAIDDTGPSAVGNFFNDPAAVARRAWRYAADAEATGSRPAQHQARIDRETREAAAARGIPTSF